MSTCGESSTPAVPVKFKLRRAPDGPMRQFTFPTRPDWNTLAGKIAQLFDLSDGSVAVTYTDSDQDEITMSSEEELQQYYSSADCAQPIKFAVTVLSTEKVPTVTLSPSNAGSTRRLPPPEEDELQWARDSLRMAGLDEETGEKVLHAFDNMVRAMGPPRRHHPFGGPWGRGRFGRFGPPGPHHHPDFFGHPGMFRHRPPYGPPFYGPPDADYGSQYEQPVAGSSATTTPAPETSAAENQTSEASSGETASEPLPSAPAPSNSGTPPPSSDVSDATSPSTSSTHGPPPFPGAHPDHHPPPPPGGHGPFGWPHPHFHHRGFHGPGHGPPHHMPPPPYPHHHRGPPPPPPPGHGPPFGPGHWYG